MMKWLRGGDDKVSEAYVSAVKQQWPALDEEKITETKGDPAMLAALLELEMGYAASTAQEDAHAFINGLDPEVFEKE